MNGVKKNSQGFHSEFMINLERFTIVLAVRHVERALHFCGGNHGKDATSSDRTIPGII